MACTVGANERPPSIFVAVPVSSDLKCLSVVAMQACVSFSGVPTQETDGLLCVQVAPGAPAPTVSAPAAPCVPAAPAPGARALSAPALGVPRVPGAPAPGVPSPGAHAPGAPDVPAA